MGAFTAELEYEGQAVQVDVPTRVFTSGYYPNLEALLELIDVRLEATDHAGAYASGNGDLRLQYANRRFLGRPWHYLAWPTMVQPRSWMLLRDARRFFKRADQDMQNPTRLAQQTFAEYLQNTGVSKRFCDEVLIPTMCVICTCGPAEVGAYPADLLLEYLTCGVLQQGVMRSSNSIADVVSRLSRGATLRCGAKITSVVPDEFGVTVREANAADVVYDQVIVATQAHQAASILSDTSVAKPLLQKVPWVSSEMWVHVDEDAVLPAKAPVRYRVFGRDEMPEVTVNMAQSFPSYAGMPSLYQVWNPRHALAEEKVLARFAFTRPVVTHASRQAMRDLDAQQGEDRLWFVGAYVADRVPLLEAAVGSAVGVASRLGVSAPWVSSREQ